MPVQKLTETEIHAAKLLLERRKALRRANTLAQDGANNLWAPEPDLLRAEHALREALQIIETLKEGEFQW